MESMDKLAEKIIEEIRHDLYEVKSYDKAHGRKLSKHILQKFFTVDAPKYKTLGDVKNALAKIYQQNGVEANNKVISSIVSSYAKRISVQESLILDEEKLSQQQMKKREEIIRAMKKDATKFKKKYGDDYMSILFATATKLAKYDTSHAPLDD